MNNKLKIIGMFVLVGMLMSANPIFAEVNVTNIAPANETIITRNDPVTFSAIAESNSTMDTVIFQTQFPDNTFSNLSTSNLIYSAFRDESESDGVADNFIVTMGDFSSNFTIDSSLLIKGAQNGTITRFSCVIDATVGNPMGGNFIYNATICPTIVENLTTNASINADCSGSPIILVANANFSELIGNVTQNETVFLEFDSPFELNNSTNFIFSFIVVSSNSNNSQNDFWRVKSDGSGVTSLYYRRVTNGTATTFAQIGETFLIGSNSYSKTFTDTSQSGIYTMRVFANDILNILNNTETTTFSVPFPDVTGSLATILGIIPLIVAALLIISLAIFIQRAQLTDQIEILQIAIIGMIVILIVFTIVSSLIT